MVYITKKIDLQTYNDLKTKGSQALKDFGFECLYDSGYIKSDREYKDYLYVNAQINNTSSANQ